MELPRFSLSRRTFVMAIVFAFLVMGASGFLTMSRREDPEIRIRVCQVRTEWPGATAENVEDLVTDPIEEKIGGIPEVKRITSQSRVGLSIISVEYEDWVDNIEEVGQQVRNKVDEVVGNLPEGCRDPFVNTTMGDVSAVVYALHQVPLAPAVRVEHPYSLRELEIIGETVRDELKTIPSVAKVELLGAHPERIYLEVGSADWAQVGITADDLGALLAARNIVAPGGSIDMPYGTANVKPTGQFRDVSEVGEVVVATTDSGAPIRLSDLDTIRIRRDYLDPPRTKVRFTSRDLHGVPSIAVTVEMKDGRNVVQMGEDLRRRVRGLYATVLPPDIELTRVNDLPRQVDASVSSFTESLWQAILIVLFVAFLMMGLRPALIMAAAIPVSMISAIAIMPLFAVELEQFSIASLIIALGMVVDNAIVVSDNSVRLLAAGGERREAMRRGAQDLAIPILASTLTTVAVFLPLGFMPGGAGEYVRSLPIVVASTLTLSYLVGMCVTPILCDWLLRADAGRSPGAVVWGWISLPLRGLRKRSPAETDGDSGYMRLARWCLSHKLVTIGLAVLALALALQLPVGSQFFPPGHRDQFFVRVWLPEGAGIRQTEEVCRQVERIVLDTSRDPETGEERLVNALTFVGFGGPRLTLTLDVGDQVPNYGYVVVNTIGPEFSKPWADSIRERVMSIPGTRNQVSAYNLGPSLENPVAFRLSGPDPDLLRETADRMIGIFRETPGSLEPFSDWANDSYQVETKIDGEAANLAGVTNRDIAATLETLFTGRKLTTYHEGDHKVPVVLRTRPEDRIGLGDLDKVFVNGRAGKVPLGSIAKTTSTWQPAVIRRRDQIRTVTVGCQAMEGFLENAISDGVEPRMRELLDTLPPGYRIEVGGSKEQTVEAQGNLGGAMVLGLIAVVLVLVAQFNSILKPLVILTTIPLALIGVMIGLYVTGWALGFMAMMGAVALFGVVINNAIVLIDFIETNIAEGDALRDATVKAGEARMRPILLTTLTTIGGLLPLGLFGGPLFAPLAWAMIFGLGFSTALTLFVIPSVYVLFAERFRMRT